MPIDPTGDFVRNLVTLRRVANGLSRDVRLEVRRLIDRIVGDIARIDPTGVARDRYRRQRTEALIEQIRARIREATPALRRDLETALARLGAQQARWAAGAVQSAVGDIATIDVRLDGMGVDYFRQILKTEPVHGRLSSEWFAVFGDDALKLASQQVRLGMAQNETVGDLIRRVRGRAVRRGVYAGGVLQTTTARAEMIVRTMVTHIANRGHLAAYEANADVVGGVEFTATLDSRTTPICARWDGTVWPLGDDAIQTPPLHPNCRSVLTPVVDWRGLGVRPPKEGTRASIDGQVKASTTYEQWFRGQSDSVQNKVIGRTRADLFRAGRLTFRDMVGRDNRLLTLDELGA